MSKKKIEKWTPEGKKCAFGAPFIAFKRDGGRYGLAQANCNKWECPLHGHQVAAQHYGRIVQGARELEKAGVKLAFLTVTCRGKDLAASEAFAHYLEWTNRLIDAMRAKSKRQGDTAWMYVQVTEKQKRSHPHSHFLTSFMPNDTLLGVVEKWKRSQGEMRLEYVPALRSGWLETEVVSAGLGEQYDISEVGEVEAASRYVAKYMFKESQFSTKFPKGWKRVRYSQSWPKLQERPSDGFIVLSMQDWAHLGSLAAVVDAYGDAATSAALRYLYPQGCIINSVTEEQE